MTKPSAHENRNRPGADKFHSEKHNSGNFLQNAPPRFCWRRDLLLTGGEASVLRGLLNARLTLSSAELAHEAGLGIPESAKVLVQRVRSKLPPGVILTTPKAGYQVSAEGQRWLETETTDPWWIEGIPYPIRRRARGCRS